MVLKVVTGKIFQTLDLSCSFDRLCYRSGASAGRRFSPSPSSSDAVVGMARNCAVVRLSKNADYLVDIQYTPIISKMKE
jgi:hypothetical protein